MGKVFLIASGKGGVGKTVFTTNMGVTLAQRGKKVVLIDMNMGLRNLDICLGLENKIVYDVADVLMGLCRIRQALVKDRRFPELYMISATPSRDKADITPLHMKVLCNKLKEKFDYIIIDAPAGIDASFDIAAAGADSAVIITVPEYVAVRDADVVDKLLSDMNIQSRCYVVNKVKEEFFSSKLVPDLEDISQVLRLKMAGVIPYDENVHVAANNGVPIVFEQGTYIQKNFDKIVDRIINE